MSSHVLLDRVYEIILRRMVATGQAPHYTEIACPILAVPEGGPAGLKRG
jgi:hypothetical protein